MATRWRRFVAVGIGAPVLAACGGPDSTEAILEDYLYRVSNATEVETRVETGPALLTYPSHRERTLEVAEIRVGFLDFLDYSRCHLTQLIGERNSILGRIMPPSARLVYEMRFLEGAERCFRRPDVEADPEFRAGLERTLAAKHASLPAVFWNATFDSPELATAFSLAGAPWDPEDTAAHTDSRRAVEYLALVGQRLREPGPAPESDELEGHYRALQLHRHGGRLLTELARLTAHLDAAAGALESLMAGRPLCYQGRPTPQARTLETVRVKFFAARVQPRLAAARRQGRAWLQAVDDLLQAQRIALPPAFTRYHRRMLSMDTEEGLWRRFESSIHRHTRAWHAVLDRCGLMPGGRP